MKALQISNRPTKFGLARVAAGVAPRTTAKWSPIDYRGVDDPSYPGAGWHRVNTRLAGICGSDLSMLEGRASVYFEEYVSFPFTPGHEIVGQLDSGQRVVIEPVLGHLARNLKPPFADASPADGNDYAHLAVTSSQGIQAGLQTGFCCSTGGGWGPWFWAHESQIHPIGDDIPDARAVLIEPLASGIHAALLTWPAIAAGHHDRHDTRKHDRPVIAVIGAGTIGLLAIAGVRQYIPNAHIIVGARYPHQMRFAKAFGGDVVIRSQDLDLAVRRATGAHIIGDPNERGYLSSGAHATIDAVGSSTTLNDALRITRPRGRVVLMGIPDDASTVDFTGLWHRETEIKGCYTYGTETMPDGSTARTFDLALDTAKQFPAEQLVSATYPLSDHVDAIAHAATAGRRGAVKIAFDLRDQLPAPKETH